MSSSPQHPFTKTSPHLLGLFVAPLLAGLMFVFLPDSLSDSARTLAAILTWVVVMWITEPIPLPITALLGCGLCVLAGLGSMKSVFAAFSHPIIFLFIGSFFISEALTVHGLDRRFGHWLLSRKWVGSNPIRIMMAVSLAVAGMSMWISNTAATAVMLPIALGVLNALRQSGKDLGRFETGFLLCLAYGAGIGGVATLIGTPPNLIGIGLLAEQANVTISFDQWMLMGLPVAVVMLLVMFVLLYWLYAPTALVSSGNSSLTTTTAPPGSWTRGESFAFGVFLLAVFLWVLPALLSIWLEHDDALVQWVRVHLPKELVPIFASGLLFLVPLNFQQGTFTLTWKQAANIHWGTILLFGGGIAFGELMVKTELAHAIGRGMVGMFGIESVWSLMGVAILTALVLTELASNTAATSMLVPVLIAISHTANFSPIPPVLAACMAASLAFVLPVSTPPNAIVYGTGRVPILRMIQAGLLLDLIGALVIWCLLRILCPLLGFQ
ncbi:MAG: SLC13 family permease [Nitrospirota bacterium]|nr:SLC13 family permease [Nitrospirota bacterium]